MANTSALERWSLRVYIFNGVGRLLPENIGEYTRRHIRRFGTVNHLGRKSLSSKYLHVIRDNMGRRSAAEVTYKGVDHNYNQPYNILPALSFLGEVMIELPTGTVTFLFTDIEGSTKL